MREPCEKRKAACPPPIFVEVLLSGELSGPIGESWSIHSEQCHACREKLEQERSRGQKYLASDHANRVATMLAAHDGRPPRARWRSCVPLCRSAVPLAAAAMVLFLVWSSSNPTTLLVAKGTAGLDVSVQRSASIVPWDGLALHDGDSIQLTWSSPEPGQLAVMGIDRDGDVTILFAGSASSSAPMPAGTGQLLGGSIRITQAMDGYRVWALFSRTTFGLACVIDQIKANHTPDRSCFQGETSPLRFSVIAGLRVPP